MDLEQQRILVQKSQEDVSAFGELYDEYYPKILNYTLRRTASVQIAQEVTSTVFFKALENIGRFRWRDIPFSAWLYRIASNEIANYYRGNGHKEYSLEQLAHSRILAGSSIEVEAFDVEADLLRHEDFLALHRRIAQLPLKYQEVITLRFFEEKQIGEKWVESGNVRYGAIRIIAGFDGQSSRAVIGVEDGRVCLVDLGRGDIEWEYRVFYREMRNTIDVRLVPDATGDGLPEILVNKGNASEVEETSPAPGGGRSTRRPLKIEVLLNGADGSEVWETQLYLEGSLTTRVDGQPVLLEPHPQLGIRVVSLKDGTPLRSLTVSGLSSNVSKIEQMSDGGYLVSSKESNLVAISSAGEVQWCYSRLSNVRVDKGMFTTDAVPDLLVSGEAAGVEGIRQVSILDGATRREIWSYDVPWVDSGTAGGLSGVQVADDLTGDGIQDVLACRGSTIFRFSGADGSQARFDIGESMAYLQPTKTGAGTPAILAGTEDGFVILDKDGNRLWESAYTDWSVAELGVVRVLNDLNQDGVSDLMMQFADRIVVARSGGTSPLGFETHLSIPAGENIAFEFKELTGDIDGDAVQEIAYFESTGDDVAAKATSSVLLVVSPVSGKVLHRWSMPVTADLSCADFNGDGFRDSLVYHQGPKAQTTIWTTSSRPHFAQTKLEVYSGKDNVVLWDLTFDGEWWNAGSEKMPAAPVGDITGDAVEDLAVSSVTNTKGTGNSSMTSAGGSCSPHETRVTVYDVLNDSLVKEIVLPPAQKDSDTIWDETHGQMFQPVSGPGDAMRLAGDLNGDGYKEIAVLASYDASSARNHCLALVDLHNGKLLGYCNKLSTLDFFEGGEDYTVAFAFGSSVYLAKVSSGLQVTWPTQGAAVGSPTRIAWEGMGESSTVTVFVDGYENVRTDDSEVTLPLKPGKHEVVVRSVDGSGIVTYASVEFKVEETPWASMLAAAALMALLLAYFSARWIRVMRNRRAEREAA